MIAFELESDARRVLEVLPKRMGRFGLTLHPQKTRLVPFARPRANQRSGKGSASIDLLGFTLYWKRTRRGRWEMAFKTRRASLGWALRSIYEWCRRHRHDSIKDQHAALTRRIRGHFNYFAVNGNLRSLSTFVCWVERMWFKWLRRRSNRTRLNWQRFRALLGRLPLPRPRVTIQIWGC